MVGSKKEIKIGNQFKKDFQVNERYFENIDTENKAYILGFISADGNISKGGLRVRLKGSDKDILEKIKVELESTHRIKKYMSKIKEKSYETCDLSIYSKKLINSLEVYGVIENKYNKVFIPNIKDELKVFWIKGYFDGNGTIDLHSKKYPRVRIASANKDLLLDINNFLNKKIGTRKTNASKIKNKECYETYFMSEDVVKIYEVFYKDSICLERKFLKFKEIIENYHRI